MLLFLLPIKPQMAGRPIRPLQCRDMSGKGGGLCNKVLACPNTTKSSLDFVSLLFDDRKTNEWLARNMLSNILLAFMLDAPLPPPK